MAKYPVLSTTLDKNQYTQYRDSKVRFMGRVATVRITSTRTQQGSWERGFKWTSTRWGLLERRTMKRWPAERRRQKWWQNMRKRSGLSLMHYYVTEYSANHGASWHESREAAFKARGKFKIDTNTTTEMAFNAIQKICREYDPNYVWRP